MWAIGRNSNILILYNCSNIVLSGCDKFETRNCNIHCKCMYQRRIQKSVKLRKKNLLLFSQKKLYFKCLTMFWMALCVFTKAYGYYSVQLRCCHVLPFVFTKHCEGAKLNLFILLHLYCVLWYHVANYLMFKLFHYLLLFVFPFIFVHGLML